MGIFYTVPDTKLLITSLGANVYDGEAPMASQAELLAGLEAKVEAVETAVSGLPGGPPMLLDASGKAVKVKRIVPREAAKDITLMGEHDAPVIRRKKAVLDVPDKGTLSPLRAPCIPLAKASCSFLALSTHDFRACLRAGC